MYTEWICVENIAEIPRIFEAKTTMGSGVDMMYMG
jgi:hypothetical protein